MQFKFLSAPKRYVIKRFKLRKTVDVNDEQWHHIVINISDSKTHVIRIDGKMAYIDDKPIERPKNKAKGE